MKKGSATLAMTPWLAALAWRHDTRAPALPRTGFRWNERRRPERPQFSAVSIGPLAKDPTSRAHPPPPTTPAPPAPAPRRPQHGSFRPDRPSFIVRPQPESCPFRFGWSFGTCLWVAPMSPSTAPASRSAGATRRSARSVVDNPVAARHRAGAAAAADIIIVRIARAHRSPRTGICKKDSRKRNGDVTQRPQRRPGGSISLRGSVC